LKVARDIAPKGSPDPDKAEIGGRIAEARRKKGWRQEDLAAKIGVTTSAVGQWERGFTMPIMATFDLLPTILDVTREWLLTGNSKEAANKALDVLENEMLRLGRLLSLRQRMDLIRMMSGLAGDESNDKSYGFGDD
jgi:transcriptional regulator with XRE-family HTH domain